MKGRAALAGLAIGFAGTVVLGFLIGAVVGFIGGGSVGFITAFFGAALAGSLCATPAAAIAMFECWLLACVLERVDASPATSRNAFVILGGVSAPLMATAALLIFTFDFEWAWAVVEAVSVLVGGYIGEVIWRILATPSPDEAPAA